MSKEPTDQEVEDQVNQLLDAYGRIDDGKWIDAVMWAHIEALMEFCEDAEMRSEICERMNHSLRGLIQQEEADQIVVGYLH